MGKAEKGTPKDIAKSIKAKGLQKLKFYCQMCQKQCRDANGFKCHLTSENHLRNMKLFSENANGIVDSNSKDFERAYLDTLRQRHGTKRVNANSIYQEVIQDRHHIHMNATRWATLSIFVQYLGKTGKCVVDEAENGWYVAYIERDAGILARREAQQRRVEAERAAEAEFAQRMEIQRTEAAKMLDRGVLHSEATNLERDESAALVSVKLHAKKQATAESKKVRSVFGDEEEDENDDQGEKARKGPGNKQIETMRAMGERNKRRAEPYKHHTSKEKRRKRDRGNEDRKDHWLRRDILVRIISKKLANGRYFRRKAVVDRVLEDKFTAEVEVLDSGPDRRDGGDILRLDQDDLETVIPNEGKTVRILNGKGRGKKAKLLETDKERRHGRLELLDDGTELRSVNYEDFSKVA